MAASTYSRRYRYHQCQPPCRVGPLAATVDEKAGAGQQQYRAEFIPPRSGRPAVKVGGCTVEGR